jgi:hypothetical protein
MFKKYTLLITTALLIILPYKSYADENMDDAKQHSGADRQHHNNHTQIQDHHHETLEIPQGEAIPTVKLKVHLDNKIGWNLEVVVSNFTFAPEKLSQQSNYNEGHAHLYVNNQKISRIYSNWYYLSSLPSGENKIKVTLNTNNHQSLVSQGKAIEDTVIINVP